VLNSSYNFATIAVVSVLWVFYGLQPCPSPRPSSTALIGGSRRYRLRAPSAPYRADGDKIPVLAFLFVPVECSRSSRPALISGAVADRVNCQVWLIFVAAGRPLCPSRSRTGCSSSTSGNGSGSRPLKAFELRRVARGARERRLRRAWPCVALCKRSAGPMIISSRTPAWSARRGPAVVRLVSASTPAPPSRRTAWPRIALPSTRSRDRCGGSRWIICEWLREGIRPRSARGRRGVPAWSHHPPVRRAPRSSRLGDRARA